MIDDEGTLSTTDVKAKFINGKPQAIEAKYAMRSQFEWDRFIRFMDRWAGACLGAAAWITACAAGGAHACRHTGSLAGSQQKGKHSACQLGCVWQAWVDVACVSQALPGCAANLGP